LYYEERYMRGCRQLLKISRMLEIGADLPLDFEFLKQFRESGAILVFTRYRTMTVKVKLEPGFKKADIDLLNYIAEGILRRKPTLLPYVWENKSLRRLAAYLRRYKSSSLQSVYQYSRVVQAFCEDFLGMSPDEVIEECLGEDGVPEPKKVMEMKECIREWLGELQAEGKAPKTINTYISAVKTWLAVNNIDIGKVMFPRRYVKYVDRAPTPEELQKMLEVANLHEKVIISILATSGVRISTLVGLKYKHIKQDFEKGIVPCAIYVPAELNKGKYCDYVTFMNEEACKYLREYLDLRRRKGEIITDESPLIRNLKSDEIRPMTPEGVSSVVRRVMKKAGIVTGNEKRYEVRPHSLRKFFKTQLSARGVPPEYVEYMMGHRTSTYLDVKSKGVEFLRALYAAADISIFPKPEHAAQRVAVQILETLRKNIEEMMKKAIIPHRTVVGDGNLYQSLFELLRGAIEKTKEEMLQ